MTISEAAMHDAQHERRFHGGAERLRAEARIALMEVPRVVMLCTDGAAYATVLDIGTGTGVFAEAFAAAGLKSTGIDPAAELLTVARTHAPQAVFLEAAAEHLPFADGSFDLVFFGHVLHETDDPDAALREARRVATKRIAILEWPFRAEESGPPLAHRLSPARVLEIAAAAGLASLRRIELTHMDLYLWDR
jgi:ubiquinone/menaquinone biosynthesis C-methylase UbiE